MVYIYDILLNFNKNLIEYFEWEEKDKIKYIKKIMVFKTTTNTIKDIIENEIILDKNFTKQIPKYEMNGLKNNSSTCLLTDGNIVIGILIKENIITDISRLLLDEENEILLIAKNLELTNINYKINNKKQKNKNLLTRKEEIIKNKLSKEIHYLYKNNNYNKLIYLYYEYTNKENKNIDYIYNFLIKTLESFNQKHINLYNILTLSNQKN